MIAKKMPNSYVSYFLMFFGLLVSSLHAEEQETTSLITLDSIFISGTKPSVDFPLNAPLNMTEFDREVINELGFARVQDVAQYVPNYNLIDAGANGFSDRSNIRGLTNTPVFTTPSVVLYVDDMPYLSSSAYTNQLVGVDSIEVYRGPQGGLFGKNSYGGVINVKSRRPDNQIQSNLSVNKGNFDSLNIDGYLGGALIKDQLYFSLGGMYSKREGYVNNVFLNSDSDFQDHLSGQVSLLWIPNSQWEIDFRSSLQDFNDGDLRAVSLSSEDIYQTLSGEQGNLDQDTNSQSLKISHQNQKFEVVSVTARRESDTAFNADFDFSPQPFFFQKTELKQQQWSQEFRIKSFDESVWRWSLGLFFSNNATSGNQTNIISQIPDNLDLNKFDETAYAAFGQISYQGFEKVRIFLDLRLDYVEKEIERSLSLITGQTTFLKDDYNEFFVSPKLTLDYAFSSQVNTYYTTGLTFKPGGFSAQSNDFPEYKKETMWHNEIGVKSSWLDQRMTADLAFFYYDIDNYQLEEIFTPFDYTVINASKVRSYGTELNLGAKITDYLHITGGFAYTQIEFEDYVDPFTEQDYENNKAPYVPRFNFNISGIFKHPSGFFARTDFLWTGKTYFDADNSEIFSEQDYKVINTSLGFEHKYFSIKAYVNNLTDNEYFTFKVARLNFGTPGEPRTFGAKVSIKY